MKRDTTRLGLYITAKRDGDWFHISATVVTLGHDAHERASIDKGEYAYPDITDQTIRNPRHSTWRAELLQATRVHRSSVRVYEPMDGIGES
jgi:hypothetical protein